MWSIAEHQTNQQNGPNYPPVPLHYLILIKLYIFPLFSIIWKVERQIHTSLITIQKDLHPDASQLNWQLTVVWHMPSSCHLQWLHQQPLAAQTYHLASQ